MLWGQGVLFFIYTFLSACILKVVCLKLSNTNYDILVYTVFIVAMVMFRMTFLMNWFTNIVMDDG